MVVEEIEIRRTSAFHTRFVDTPDGSLNGVLRLTSSESTTRRVLNICGIVQANPGRTQIYFGKDHLFFYGTQPILQRNYNRDLAREAPDLMTKLRAFKDREYAGQSEPRSDAVRNAGFFAISVEDLGLSHTRKQMLDLLVYEAELVLPLLVSRLEPVSVRRSTRAEKIKFFGAFTHIPTELMEDAITAGKFYQATITKKETRHELVNVPRARVIYDSFVSSPKWMRAYLRRHG